ncbi:cytochrome c oxidase subunit 3 [Salibacterium aidingense]|uniref:cytochrome c oxidase subunit 3 n=1 Tax=Salibacterium aidingense TaxID=384933 RepID=UPI00040EE9B2|nr:cytochrome c oxidase subunit 3 [Salibacterium aidingense]
MADSAGISSINGRPWSEADDRLGMWLFIGAETVVFLCLFATYLALSSSTLEGPGPSEILELPPILLPSALLLLSSWTFHVAEKGLEAGQLKKTIIWLGITMVLGFAFLGFEIHEFTLYAAEGAVLTESPFLAGFFVLVGTHGAHVLFGSVWMAFLLGHLASKKIVWTNWKRIRAFGLYWHFVDVVWVFIFTIVYVLGSQGMY